MTLEKRLDAIERKRNRLLAFATGMDAALAAARPEPETWSVQEIVEHLVLSESAVFGNLDELDQRRSKPRRLKDRTFYFVVMFILRFAIPVRVPSPDMRPGGEVSIPRLRERWESNHARLRAWIRSAEGPRLEQALFVHPVAGPMTTNEALRMLEVHLDRHARQIFTSGANGRSGRPA